MDEFYRRLHLLHLLQHLLALCLRTLLVNVFPVLTKLNEKLIQLSYTVDQSNLCVHIRDVIEDCPLQLLCFVIVIVIVIVTFVYTSEMLLKTAHCNCFASLKSNTPLEPNLGLGASLSVNVNEFIAVKRV